MFIFILRVKLGETTRMQKGASEGRQISAPDAAADGLCDSGYVSSPAEVQFLHL